MKIVVVDASTSLKWVFEDEVDSQFAKQLLKDWLSHQVELVSPSLWHYEITNSLKSITLKNKNLNPNDVLTKLNKLLKIQPSIIPMENVLQDCLRNSIKLGVSGYDSMYVTLGILSHAPLVTSDQKLTTRINNPHLAISLKDYYNGSN